MDFFHSSIMFWLMMRTRSRKRLYLPSVARNLLARSTKKSCCGVCTCSKLAIFFVSKGILRNDKNNIKTAE